MTEKESMLITESLRLNFPEKHWTTMLSILAGHNLRAHDCQDRNDYEVEDHGTYITIRTEGGETTDTLAMCFTEMMELKIPFMGVTKVEIGDQTVCDHHFACVNGDFTSVWLNSDGTPGKQLPPGKASSCRSVDPQIRLESYKRLGAVVEAEMGIGGN